MGDRRDTADSDTIRGTVLLIEDDASIRRLLRASFDGTGLKLIECVNGSDGLEIAKTKPPDLVLLDLALPDISGLEIVQILRTWTMVPIIILSALGQDRLKVECLNAGADDYVTKPFSIAELIARVRAGIRRAILSAVDYGESVFECDGLRVDLAARDVYVRGERLHMTPLEYKLLAALIKHPGKLVTHERLLAEVWGPEYVSESQYLRLYVGYLRKKLESPGGTRRYIQNEPGVGYRFVVEA